MNYEWVHVAGLVRLLEELCRACSADRNHGYVVGWPLLWALQPDANAGLEAEAPGRKWEEELRLERDVQVSATPRASEPADKVGELVVSGRT